MQCMQSGKAFTTTKSSTGNDCSCIERQRRTFYPSAVSKRVPSVFYCKMFSKVFKSIMLSLYCYILLYLAHALRHVTHHQICVYWWLMKQWCWNSTGWKYIKHVGQHHYILFLPSHRREREAYYVRRAEGVTNPSKILSLILDGMDQSKTNIPHFQGWESPKVRV